jgi:hypothetical protein
MSCCGQRRNAWRQPEPAVTPVPAPVVLAPMLVRFLGRGPVIVRGAGTGMSYEFPADATPLAVDYRDVDGFVGTAQFAPV